jgi:hypothetical protein
MSALLSVADVRDWVIVVYGIIGIVFFFVAVIVTIVLFFTIKGLLGAVRNALDESVIPALSSVKEAADTVRGTTEFVGRTAVTPVAKAYGTYAGIKKGLSVLSGLKGRARSK